MGLSSVNVTLRLIAATSLVSASQSEPSNYYGQVQSGSCYPKPGTPLNVVFPLYIDNFPDTEPGSEDDRDIANRAHGTRANNPPPKTVSNNTLISIRLTAQNQLFGVAYLYQLIAYITKNKPGFYIKNSRQRAYALKELTAIQAQEEQHILRSNSLLARFGQKPVRPCKYTWPAGIRDYSSAINSAGLLTMVLSGSWQSIIRLLGETGDVDLIQEAVSITQEESQFAGWFRSESGLLASSNPFTTPVSRELAFSLLNQVAFVPGSCTENDFIELAVFGPLIVVQPPLPCNRVDQLVVFSVQTTDVKSLDGYVVVYVNQQNEPVVEQINEPQVEGGCVRFSAIFPCRLTSFGDGLTLAVVANKSGPFMGVDDLTRVVVFGPALIYYN